EIQPHRLGPDKADVMGQIGVGAVKPVRRLATGTAVEVDDLAGGMHPGIGAPGAEQLNWMIGYPRQCFLDFFLNTAHARLLTLPAAISRPAVLNTGCHS